MFAVIETGGKQYKVSEGDIIFVEKLVVEEGSTYTFEKVLALSGNDGFVVGTGVSYDLLKYSVSLTYMFSDTGVWHSDVDDFRDNMLIASFRYKYSENVDGWISGGTTSKTPFVSAGLRLTF